MIEKAGCCLFIFCLFFWLASCKKKAPDCGCAAPNIDTLTNVPGALSYNKSIGKYEIITEGFGDEIDNYICNTDFSALRDKLDSAKITTIHVKFSGFVKAYCKMPGIYIDQPTSFEITALTDN